MLTSLKKVALAGLGVKQRVQKTLDALVQEGEASEGEDARRLKAVVDLAERGKEEIRQKVGDIRRRVSCIIPTRADLERLEKKIDDLAARKNEG
jgi:polyhydroxyalkanoate synthesis regulator phasin